MSEKDERILQNNGKKDDQTTYHTNLKEGSGSPEHLFLSKIEEEKLKNKLTEIPKAYEERKAFSANSEESKDLDYSKSKSSFPPILYTSIKEQKENPTLFNSDKAHTAEAVDENNIQNPVRVKPTTKRDQEWENYVENFNKFSLWIFDHKESLDYYSHIYNKIGLQILSKLQTANDSFKKLVKYLIEMKANFSTYHTKLQKEYSNAFVSGITPFMKCFFEDEKRNNSLMETFISYLDTALISQLSEINKNIEEEAHASRENIASIYKKIKIVDKEIYELFKKYSTNYDKAEKEYLQKQELNFDLWITQRSLHRKINLYKKLIEEFCEIVMKIWNKAHSIVLLATKFQKEKFKDYFEQRKKIILVSSASLKNLDSFEPLSYSEELFCVDSIFSELKKKEIKKCFKSAVIPQTRDELGILLFQLPKSVPESPGSELVELVTKGERKKGIYMHDWASCCMVLTKDCCLHIFENDNDFVPIKSFHLRETHRSLSKTSQGESIISLESSAKFLSYFAKEELKIVNKIDFDLWKKHFFLQSKVALIPGQNQVE